MGVCNRYTQKRAVKPSRKEPNMAENYGVPRANKLNRDAFRAKVKAFEKIAVESEGEKRRKALKQAAWYRHYLRKNFKRG
jgi:hypothetical protein